MAEFVRLTYFFAGTSCEPLYRGSSFFAMFSARSAKALA